MGYTAPGPAGWNLLGAIDNYYLTDVASTTIAEWVLPTALPAYGIMALTSGFGSSTSAGGQVTCVVDDALSGGNTSAQICAASITNPMGVAQTAAHFAVSGGSTVKIVQASALTAGTTYVNIRVFVSN